MSEDHQLEWKENWRDEYLKWICAFANSEGGALEIGRNDKGQVVGLPKAAQLLEELPNKIRNLLGVVANVSLLNEEDLAYLRIEVDPYPYPVSYKGEYHVRSGSTKQVLKGAALDRFLLSRTGKRWDAVPVPNVTVSDLDTDTLNRFRERAGASKRLATDALRVGDEALIEKLRLTDGGYLKRAAVLLFHPDPERLFTGAAVKIGYFADETDLRYHDLVEGNLFTQVNKTMELLLSKYLKAVISYEGIQRLESYPMPESALREALLNAVVHRDYAVAAPIQIRVYADRLRIWNPGELPEGWSETDLMDSHASLPYNPDVANAFFRSGEIEAWGRGIERVFQACEAAGTPKPLIRFEHRDVWVEFPFSKAYLAALAAEENVPQPESQPESQPKSQLESLQKQVLVFLKVEPKSKSELSKDLGQKAISGQLNKVVRLCLKEELIEYTIPDKPKSRLQKYRLTRKGQSAQNRMALI